MAEEYRPWTWRPEKGVVGVRGFPRKDGYDKASGKGVYARDLYLPGMLFAKPLLSPYAHAEIKSMDTTAAAALPGVRDILRYDDPEGQMPIWEGIFVYPDVGQLCFPDQKLVEHRALWFPQPVGAIVCADSESICNEALRLIEVEWEELPFILDPEEALEAGAPLLRPDLNPDSNMRIHPVFPGHDNRNFGDVEEGMQEADKIVEFKLDKNEEDVWAGVEGNCAVAQWRGDNAELWVHDQCPDFNQDIVATKMAGSEYATTDVSKVTMHAPYNGGMFGGLTWQRRASIPTRWATVLAKRTGKPVKMLEDSSNFDGADHIRGREYYKVGFKNDGTVTAVDGTFYLTETFIVLNKMWEGTKVAHLHLEQNYPYVNRSPQACYRHGTVACSVNNMVFDHVSGELGMDPTEVALINDGGEGHDMAYITEHVKAEQGFDPTRDSLKEVLAVGKAAIDWDNKWHSPGTKILPNGKYHGIGFVWNIGWGHGAGQLSMALRMQPDGTVNILARHADAGWDSETAYCQIVAEEVGVKYEDVSMRPFDDTGFQAANGAGSSGCSNTTPAMIGAARELKQKIVEYSLLPIPGGLFGPGSPAPMEGLAVEEIDCSDGFVFEIANPENKVPISTISSLHSQKLFAAYYPPIHTDTMHCMVRQAHFVEIEVDPDTGGVEVTKTVVVNDVGQAISPETVNGQQYGGCYMGQGRTWKEAIYYDEATGVKLNDNLIGYPVTVMNDIGPIDCHIVETHLAYAPYGHTGIGESGSAMEATIGGPAIYNAIGKWIDDFPITPNKVLKALGKA
ncbi:xanthine dehydrogenase family protein molybdopterin-binding subunit [Chloroflexota bacterium]